MGNNKHDAHPYEDRGYQREMYDLNVLHDAFNRARKSSAWKTDTQKFSMYWLLEITKMSQQLKNKTYRLSPSAEFTINERGKVRYIHGERMRDRVIKHALCDEIVNPSIEPYLISDNSASRKNKGIDYARKRLEDQIHKFYRETGSNEGYILIMDFSKYYDNIRHDILLDEFRKYIHNETALWMLEQIIHREEIDVSYMSDSEYTNCMNQVFNSLDYHKLQFNKTGRKMMKKHLNIGDQSAQAAGIMYPIPWDNFAKIILRIKKFSRYMDDSAIIARTKAELMSWLELLDDMAKRLGIFINRRKTRLCKLSSKWRFLQIEYTLTETGHLIRKINPKRLHVHKRKLKKLAGVISEAKFDDLYKCWFCRHLKYMSKKQRTNLESLYFHLKEQYYEGKCCIGA